ncbi:hypothetical protein E3N88_22644 [Mikania micrantha]|uniref:Uncharacterized protein n=1 Tax=Mikania micrantha TaxID=192012 RepID=A0A5N6NCG5_9ASTR|nr:hypothetical protein E3N88_22644 [Mikania micrantha]
MVVSFKIARSGSRYRPRPKLKPPSVEELDDVEVDTPADQLSDIQFRNARKRSVDVIEDDCNVAEDLEDEEVSFILNIFPNGYTIVNPSKRNVGHQIDVQDYLKFLHPYDRRSESLITAIECGQLPVDFLDDLHCKYVNGTVLCEVRDFRNKSSESAVNDSLTAAFPSITKVSLKMSLDNVVKDINRIADCTWEYGDLLLNLDIRGKRLKRLRQVSTPQNSCSNLKDLREVTGQHDLVNMVDQNVGQRNLVVIGPKSHASENSNLSVRDLRQVMSQPDFAYLADQNVGQSNMGTTRSTIHAPEQSNTRVGDLRWITGKPDFVNLIDQNVGQSNMIARGSKNHAQVSTFSSVSHQSSHQIGAGNVLNMKDNANHINSSLITSSVYDKQGNHCQVLSPVNLNKRGRSAHVGLDGNQDMDYINASKYRLKNTQVKLPLTIQQINDMIFSQYNVKKEPVETEKINKPEPSRLHQRLPLQFTRANFHKAPWNNMSPNLENNAMGKDFSSGSGGLQFGAVSTSMSLVGETQCLTFIVNKSMQQAQMTENWRSNTLQKTQAISELGSSSSAAFNMIGPYTASSTVIRSMQDRFSKIKMLTARFKLNSRKNKIDEYKPVIIFPKEQLKHVLFGDHGIEDLNDETCKMPLSMSLMGGNINICKTRVLNFVQNELPIPENGFVAIPRFHTRLILSERQSDGTVAMHLGELDAVDYLAEDRLLPTLPNTHMADLLAEQFCFLMIRDNYHMAGDHLKPKPISMVRSADGQPNTSSVDFNRWLQQILESDPSESVYNVDEPSIGGASHHNMYPQKINNNMESQLQNKFLQEQEEYQIQRGMIMTPGCTEHNIDGNNKKNNSMVGFQGLGMDGDGHAGTRVESTMTSQNPMANKQGMFQSKTNGSGALLGQSSNFGGLQGATRHIQLGSNSGSGSSGVLIPGSGAGINRANDMNPMQRNVMAHLNPNPKRYMKQLQFQLIKQEPTSHLQAVVLSSQQAGSPSPSPSIGRSHQHQPTSHQTGSPSPIIGRPHQQVGPHQPTP